MFLTRFVPKACAARNGTPLGALVLCFLGAPNARIPFAVRSGCSSISAHEVSRSGALGGWSIHSTRRTYNW